MKILHDRVLVEIQPELEKNESGIIIPDSARKKNEGTVLIVGEKVKALQVGNKVKYYDHAGTPIEYDGKKCLMLSEEHEVIAVL